MGIEGRKKKASAANGLVRISRRMPYAHDGGKSLWARAQPAKALVAIKIGSGYPGLCAKAPFREGAPPRMAGDPWPDWTCGCPPASPAGAGGQPHGGRCLGPEPGADSRGGALRQGAGPAFPLPAIPGAWRKRYMTGLETFLSAILRRAAAYNNRREYKKKGGFFMSQKEAGCIDRLQRIRRRRRP